MVFGGWLGGAPPSAETYAPGRAKATRCTTIASWRAPVYLPIFLQPNIKTYHLCTLVHTFTTPLLHYRTLLTPFHAPQAHRATFFITTFLPTSLPLQPPLFYPACRTYWFLGNAVILSSRAQPDSTTSQHKIVYGCTTFAQSSATFRKCIIFVDFI